MGLNSVENIAPMGLVDPLPPLGAPQPPRISLRKALAFPFTHPNWPQALLYIGAIQYIPILGYLIIRGWRFDIARRIGNGHAEQLPDWRAWKSHLREGVILFFATQFYFLPLYFFLWYMRHDIYYAIAEIVVTFYEQYWKGLPGGPRSEVLWAGAKALAWVLAALLLYPPVAASIIESATQRYAVTGRVRTLYEFWWNVWLVGDDFLDVLRIELSILGVTIAVFVVSLLLLWTLGGTIFIPALMIPIYMWTRGSLMGSGSGKIASKGSLPKRPRRVAARSEWRLPGGWREIGFSVEFSHPAGPLFPPYHFRKHCFQPHDSGSDF